MQIRKLRKNNLIGHGEKQKLIVWTQNAKK